MIKYTLNDYDDTDFPNGGSAKFADEVERLNFYDQEVRNWAKMSDKVYIKVHVVDFDVSGVANGNVNVTFYDDSDNIKASIGLEVKDTTETNVARVEDYIDGDEDFVIISVDKDKQEEIIGNLVLGSLEFKINNRDLVGSSFNDLSFKTRHEKYLPEILTTKYSSAHAYRPKHVLLRRMA